MEILSVVCFSSNHHFKIADVDKTFTALEDSTVHVLKDWSTDLREVAIVCFGAKPLLSSC